MKRLTFIVIFAALLWSGFWVWSASSQKSAISRWFDARRAEGWAADYSDLQIFGFPNRLDTTLTNPRLGDPDSGLFWEAPFLQLLRLTYNPSHLIAVWSDNQSFATPYQSVQVTSTDMRASLKFSDVASWSPYRLILVAEGLGITSDQNWDLSADTAQISLEQVEDQPTAYRLALDARGVEGALPGWIDITGPEGQEPGIDRLTADIEVSLTEPLTRLAIEDSRPQPHSLHLKLAEATWAGLNLAAAGQLEVSASGTPNGTLTLKVRNWRDMLARERQTGRLSKLALDQIDFTLTLISGLSGNPETLDLPFDFANGKVWLGPLMIGNSPRIVIP